MKIQTREKEDTEMPILKINHFIFAAQLTKYN